MVPPQGEQEPCELQAIGDARRDEVARPPLAQVTHEQLVALARLLHQGDEPRVASLTQLGLQGYRVTGLQGYRVRVTGLGLQG